jgi:hypothetical protein
MPMDDTWLSVQVCHTLVTAPRDNRIVVSFWPFVTPSRCPRCGEEDVRPSRRPPGFVLRLLGLNRYRCMSCWARLILREPAPERERQRSVGFD